MHNRTMQFVSLFSGCGGFDLGLTQKGFQCRGAIDIDPVSLGVHRANLDSPTYQWDLSTGKLPSSLPASVDVVIAGAPCQGFSTLGKRRLDDPRNSLLVTGGKLALQLRPRVFVAENVLTVRSGAHSKYWNSLRHLFQRANYQTRELVLDGRHLGIAQSRRRAFLIAWNTKSHGKISMPCRPLMTIRTAFDGIANLPQHVPNHLDPDSADYQIAARIAPGQKLCNVRNGPSAVHTWDIPEVFGSICEAARSTLVAFIRIRRTERRRAEGDADPLEFGRACEQFGRAVIDELLEAGYLRLIGSRDEYVDLTHAFNGKFRRLDADAQSTTVDTRFCNHHYVLHPWEHRGLTTREAARLQGFPDDFLFSGTRHDAILIGNAVPPSMGAFIGEYISQTLLSP